MIATKPRKKKSLIGWTYIKCVPAWCGENRFNEHIVFPDIYKIKGDHSKYKVKITIQEL